MIEFTNSIGMRFVSIPTGSFLMGDPNGGDPEEGDFDEKPVHRVKITSPFYAGVTPVTNIQYEQFDPSHKAIRGKNGFSKEDDEAVLYVSWHEAVNFCQWLSEKEGKPHRLLTEAEWEYACRAGTDSAYWTGDELPVEHHRNQFQSRRTDPVSLETAQLPANPWGLHDMHGLVEEWCSDWYGPYDGKDTSDPIGPVTGESKVTRGGSHSTPVAYLRSSSRLGALPQDKDWVIGFRVAQADTLKSEYSGIRQDPVWARNVSQRIFDWSKGPNMDKPYFTEPQPFVHIPPDSNGPLYSRHNHCPAITWCPNGDLFAVWFSTIRETGRELTIAASRLRRGGEEWESSGFDLADLFFKVPDRNMSGSSLWNDGNGTLYYFNGMGTFTIRNMFAVAMRKSTDNGVTWSQSEIIQPHYQPRGQVVAGTFATKEGFIIVPADAQGGGFCGTVLYISRDGGKTFHDPGDLEKTDQPGTAAEMAGVAARADIPPGVDFPEATIAGYHAGIVQLKDGSLFALGRCSDIDGRMPISRSNDMGRTWRFEASEFPILRSGQRLVLMRLREGPLLFISFTDVRPGKRPVPGPDIGLLVPDASGKKRRVYGLFAALSFDEGNSWPVKRLISDDSDGRQFGEVQWLSDFTMDYAHGERVGYMAATQTPDGIIHLVSSALYYSFNLAWLCKPMPAMEESFY